MQSLYQRFIGPSAAIANYTKRFIGPLMAIANYTIDIQKVNTGSKMYDLQAVYPKISSALYSLVKQVSLIKI